MHRVYWLLPLPLALQFFHCALRASLAWTIPPTDRNAVLKRAEEIHSLALRLPPAKDDLDDD